MTVLINLVGLIGWMPGWLFFLLLFILIMIMIGLYGNNADPAGFWVLVLIIVFIMLGILDLRGCTASQKQRRVAEIIMSNYKSQLEQMRDRSDSLRKKIESEIPSFENLLTDQARRVKNEIKKVPGTPPREMLDRELHEIARLLVALDKYDVDCRDVLAMTDSSVRQLERILLSNDLLEPEAEQFVNQASEVEAKASALLEAKLASIGSGSEPVSDLEVDKKLNELKVMP